MTDSEALQALIEDEGFDSVDDAIECYVYDSVVPGICPVCGYCASRMEPDQCAGWCEECDAGTVQSLLVLAGYC